MVVKRQWVCLYFSSKNRLGARWKPGCLHYPSSFFYFLFRIRLIPEPLLCAGQDFQSVAISCPNSHRLSRRLFTFTAFSFSSAFSSLPLAGQKYMIKRHIFYLLILRIVLFLCLGLVGSWFLARVEPGPSAVKAESLNHWTIRQFPIL